MVVSGPTSVNVQLPRRVQRNVKTVSAAAQTPSPVFATIA